MVAASVGLDPWFCAVCSREIVPWLEDAPRPESFTQHADGTRTHWSCRPGEWAWSQLKLFAA